MKFIMNKEEIIGLIKAYVDSMFTDKDCITIELSSKPKSGVFATIEVTPKEMVRPNKPVLIEPVEPKKEKQEEPPKKVTPLKDFDVIEEKNENASEEVVTTESLFSKISS